MLWTQYGFNGVNDSVAVSYGILIATLLEAAERTEHH